MDFLGSQAGAEVFSPDSGYEPCSAELAECVCPDFCERDHDNE